MELNSAEGRPRVRAMYIGYSEQGEQVWALDCAGKFFIARQGDDAESYDVQRGEWMPMPAGIFDVLIAELLAHPELARAKYEKPIG